MARLRKTVKTGEVGGSVSATAFPNVTCNLVRFKARSDNSGSVFIGPPTVTVPDGNTDTTTGFELGPGEETGWIPIGDLNKLEYICENVGDDLTYMCLE